MEEEDTRELPGVRGHAPLGGAASARDRVSSPLYREGLGEVVSSPQPHPQLSVDLLAQVCRTSALLRGGREEERPK